MLKDVFSVIYRENRWQDQESRSGPGSTLAYTKHLRGTLVSLFRERGITKVFDAPCGDFNWMREVTCLSGVEYFGADVVPELIDRVHTLHGAPKLEFHYMDITTAAFPTADIMICRDLLFHLSYESAFCILERFACSRIPFLLTSTHINPGGLENSDIEDGGFRLIDLELPPFNMPVASLRISDWLPPFPPRELVLLSRLQVYKALVTNGRVF